MISGEIAPRVSKVLSCAVTGLLGATLVACTPGCTTSAPQHEQAARQEETNQVSGAGHQDQASRDLEARNTELVRRFHDEVLGQGNLEVLDELLAEDYRGHGVPGQVTEGPEAFKQLLLAVAQAFPDAKRTVDATIAEGDLVAVRTVHTGTHRGDFMGIPPTGRSVEYRQIHIWRVADGKIAEHWVQRDDLGLLYQLGAIEVPEPLRQRLGWQKPPAPDSETRQ